MMDADIKIKAQLQLQVQFIQDGPRSSVFRKDRSCLTRNVCAHFPEGSIVFDQECVRSLFLLPLVFELFVTHCRVSEMMLLAS